MHKRPLWRQYKKTWSNVYIFRDTRIFATTCEDMNKDIHVFFQWSYQQLQTFFVQFNDKLDKRKTFPHIHTLRNITSATFRSEFYICLQVGMWIFYFLFKMCFVSCDCFCVKQANYWRLKSALKIMWLINKSWFLIQNRRKEKQTHIYNRHDFHH